MKTSSIITAKDHIDRAVMIKLHQERGAQTEKSLLAAGISLESQARNCPWVAEQVRASAMDIAA